MKILQKWKFEKKYEKTSKIIKKYKTCIFSAPKFVIFFRFKYVFDRLGKFISHCFKWIYEYTISEICIAVFILKNYSKMNAVLSKNVNHVLNLKKHYCNEKISIWFYWVWRKRVSSGVTSILTSLFSKCILQVCSKFYVNRNISNSSS